MQLQSFYKIVTHFLVSIPFPCISLPLPLLLWVARLVATFWCVWGMLQRVVPPGVLRWEKYDVHGSGFTLHLILLCTVHIMYVRYHFFVSTKSSFVQLQACISLTDHQWAVYSHQFSNAKPVPCLLSSLACTPLHPILSAIFKASAIISGLCFSTLHHCASCKSLILHNNCLLLLFL